MLIREKIKRKIECYLEAQKLDLSPVWQVELPKERSVADYATNLAFIAVKHMKKSPQEIAQEMAVGILDYFSEPEWKGMQITALRGFINFTLSPSFCYDALRQDAFATQLVEPHAKILLEYVSANPTGPLHIGHGRWAALGDSLWRMMKRVGYQVDTEFYINDAGNQIDHFLMSVNAHRSGQAIPEGGYGGSYVKELVGSSDPVKDILEQQKKTLTDFRVHFDKWFSEKIQLHETGLVKESVALLTQKNLTYEEEGAILFKSTKFGDDKDRVLIKGTGEYTYFASDVAYHMSKVSRGYRHLINIWGADHHGYIARVRAGLTALADEDVVFEVVLGQLVTLFREGQAVRMSKRTGDMISLQEVMDEIGVDATRFFLVLKSADTALDFDLNLAKKKSNDNPVFYVQYAHARICSILRKSTYQPKLHTHLELVPEEYRLLKFLLSFEEELFVATERHEPHRIAKYLMDLATNFHSFYHACKVNVEDQILAEHRLAMSDLTRNILSIGLELLGVNAPESM